MKQYIKLWAWACLLFGASVCSVAQQAPNYGWPVRCDQPGNTNHRGNVAGTPSELRGAYGGQIFGVTNTTAPRFHAGVDISSFTFNGSREVYSIENVSYNIRTIGNNPDVEGGTGWNARIRLNNTIYYHSEILDSIANGQSIAPNQHIAYYAVSAAHVHIMPTLQTLAGTPNPILRLPGYQDNSAPQVLAARLYRNGITNASTPQSDRFTMRSLNNINHAVVYDKVDMVIDTDDEKTNTFGLPYGQPGNIGPNRFFTDIRRLVDVTSPSSPWVSMLGGWQMTLDFSVLPPLEAAPFVFAQGSTTAAPRYIVTSRLNRQPYDIFWNSRLRRNQVENHDLLNRGSLDARESQEAAYPDGIARVEFTVQDLDSDGAANGLYSNVHTTPILLDNFRPYIRMVKVYRLINYLRWPREKTSYLGLWKWNPTLSIMRYNDELSFSNSAQIARGYQGGVPRVVTGPTSNEPIVIEIRSSEPLQQISLGLERLQAPGNALNPQQDIPRTAFNTFSGNRPYISHGDTLFYFHLNPARLNSDHDGLHILAISGSDYAGNPLCGLQRTAGTAPNQQDPRLHSPQAVPASGIPIRGAYGFSPPNMAGATGNTDRLHGFILDGTTCTPRKNGDCLTVDITSPGHNALLPAGGSANFSASVSGGTPSYLYEWFFSDPAMQAAAPNSAAFNLGLPQQAGIIQYALRVTDSDGAQEIRFDTLRLYSPNTDPVACFTASTLVINEGGSITFRDCSWGGTLALGGSYTYNWTFPAGAADRQKDLVANPAPVKFSVPGTYQVSLEIKDNGGRSSTIVQNITVTPSLSLNLEVVSKDNNQRFAWFEIKNAGSWFNTYGYFIDWDFSDPISAFNRQYGMIGASLAHQFVSTHNTFLVRATVRNLNGTYSQTLSAEVSFRGPMGLQITYITPGSQQGFNRIYAGQAANYTVTVIDTVSKQPMSAPLGYHYEYKWEFGSPGGANITYANGQATQTHTYVQPGFRYITVYVKTARDNPVNSNIPDCWTAFDAWSCDAVAIAGIRVEICAGGHELPNPLYAHNTQESQLIDAGCPVSTLSNETIICSSYCGSRDTFELHYPVVLDGEFMYPHSTPGNWRLLGASTRADYDYNFRLFRIQPVYRNNGSLRRYDVFEFPKKGSVIRSDNDPFRDSYAIPAYQYFKLDWDEFQKSGSEKNLYYARIAVIEKACRDSFVMERYICPSVHCVTGFSCTICHGDTLKPVAPRNTDFPSPWMMDSLSIQQGFLNNGFRIIPGRMLQSSGSWTLTETLHLKAHDEVLLTPGFVALEGSYFTAKIDNIYECFEKTNNFRVVDENAAEPGSLFELQAYPNPGHSGKKVHADLFTDKSQEVRLELSDLHGRLRWKHSVSVSPGRTGFELPSEGLAQGLYLLRAMGHSSSKTIKLLITNP